MKFSLRSILGFVALCAIAIVIAKGVHREYLRYSGESGQGVTAHEANQMLWPELHLPREASDVRYYTDFGCAEAEFAITEDVFLRWCRANGWTVTEITTPSVYFDPFQLDPDHQLVEDGYRFDLSNGEGTFDASRSRACFTVLNFP